MTQGDLFGWRQSAPYARESDTSHAAAQRVAPKLSALQSRILVQLRARDGLTCKEIEGLTGLDHQTASARIWELKDMCKKCRGRITYENARRRCTCRHPIPYLEDTGQRRKRSTVWRVVP